MSPRLVLLVGLLALLGTGCRNNEGAVKLTVSYSGFKPGCIRVGVRDAQGAGEPRTTELPGKGEPRSGSVTVAAFRESGWGTTLLVTAEAFETECSGTPVTIKAEEVAVNPGEVAAKELRLEATDADEDGYVSMATGGTDCDDTGREQHPGAQELCNDRDDNCDGRKDETFEVGQMCDVPDNGCKGAWTCNPQGARACVARPGQWRKDADNDGQGDKVGMGLTSCTQPLGYVANDLDCDDTNPQRFSGAPELCNAVDDNCDGVPDDGLQLNADCTGEGSCMGKRVCGTDGGVICNNPKPAMLYADNDSDTYGTADAGVMNCGPTRAGYVANSTDCDDTRAQVNPAAREICDSLDNNCDGTQDEGYSVGTACSPGYNCPGTTACVADGGTQCAFTTMPSNYYPDEDLDNHGKPDAGVLTCTPDAGYVPLGDDCDDGNPFTYANAPELCDQVDNNCQGTVDEGGVCPAGGGGWVSQSTTTSENWRSVTLWGAGGVWVTGSGNALRSRPPGETTFRNFDGHCAGDWYGISVDPVYKYAVLVGQGTAVAYHGPTDAACITPSAPAAADTHARGVTIFSLADGSTEAHIAGISMSNSDRGRVVSRTLGGDRANPNDVGPLMDVHGLSRDALFAVGGYLPGKGSTPRVYRFHQADNDWKTENVQDISGVVGEQLRGVWVVNSKLAYAVGNKGSVLMWNGSTWSKHSAPSGDDLLSVVAFGKSSIYVSTDNGKVFRYNGSTWTAMPATGGGGALNDIAASRPDDIWVVGSGGRLLHWPQ
ncbi:MopE-related protein [Archangium violaceum]|uniref:MopE-related protein n=1 Tax=Archangium violaceum TaxID=83451 RepID=UPI002B284542|nr:MopE-related protein [Archangium gephyra]